MDARPELIRVAEEKASKFRNQARVLARDYQARIGPLRNDYRQRLNVFEEDADIQRALEAHGKMSTYFNGIRGRRFTVPSLGLATTVAVYMTYNSIQSSSPHLSVVGGMMSLIASSAFVADLYYSYIRPTRLKRQLERKFGSGLVTKDNFKALKKIESLRCADLGENLDLEE